MPLQNQPGTPPDTSFASLLAALAAPKVHPSPGFDDLLDGLQDDVATLSYERALQTHGRYKASDPVYPPAPSAGRGAPPDRPLPAAAPDPAAEHKPAAPAPACPADPEAGRKRASVTLRMSRAECARLQQLAAEAGLTVSAYLRFCAFEVESLRAQVKTALAEMRTPQTGTASASGPRWLRFFRPHA
ncbi:MAG: plasmid mobilization protein [Acidobacteriota bacterium]